MVAKLCNPSNRGRVTHSFGNEKAQRPKILCFHRHICQCHYTQSSSVCCEFMHRDYGTEISSTDWHFVFAADNTGLSSLTFTQWAAHQMWYSVKWWVNAVLSRPCNGFAVLRRVRNCRVWLIMIVPCMQVYGNWCYWKPVCILVVHWHFVVVRYGTVCYFSFWCCILAECSSPFGSQNTEWNDFLDVYKLLERLRKKQQS